MNPHPSPSLALMNAAEAILSAPALPLDPPVARAADAELKQRSGKRMILAGAVITIVGVVLYCAACFSGGADADMGDLLLHDAIPLARVTLGVLGLGTCVWLVGSFTYLRGAMEADDPAGDQRKTGLR